MRNCFGCGVCIDNCKDGALKNKNADFQYSLACAAKACIEDKTVIYLNELKRISKSTLLFLPLTPLIFVLIGAAAGAERIYYSIHLDSFKNLENVNNKIGCLKYKGKLVFWKETDIPSEGRFYKVYLGKYENRDEAIAYWKKLKKVGAASHFSIHLFT